MKRLPRELRHNIGRYMAVFILLTVVIAAVSGFLVAGESAERVYRDNFEKSNIESGGFITAYAIDQETIKNLEKLENGNLKVYQDFYREYKVDDKQTLRLLHHRTEYNKMQIMEGKLPESQNEIALDRLYAKYHNIQLNDTIKIDESQMKVVGTVAASDYSALFQNPHDIMFDVSTFGIALVSDSKFESFANTQLVYHYSFMLGNKNMSDIEKNTLSKDIISQISKNNVVSDFSFAENNQAISFAGDDMGSDIPMMKTLLYIIIVIMSFVFAVIIGNTIESEAAVIGTLLANGYSKHELIRHYMTPAIIISVLSGIVGNLIGYTLIVGFMKSAYYNSYALPPYHTYWNADAFIYTTVIPVVLLIFITYISLLRKMSLTPLQFLRKELKKKKIKGALRLPSFSFINRFRLRIVLQNKGNYLVLFVGIFFASFILIWGICINPTIDKYEKDVANSTRSDYQYIVKVPVPYESITKGEDKSEKDPEKFTVSSMDTYYKLAGKNIEISVYGIQENSQYFEGLDVKNNSDGVYLSENLSKKLGKKKGSTIALYDKYNDKTYDKKILGTYDYAGSLAIFMTTKDFNQMTGKDAGYFNGYLSNQELTFKEGYVSSTITVDDMQKLGRQIDNSMGSMVYIIIVMSIIIFLVLMYILTKIVIEKNAISISFMKVFGYEEKEIQKVYLHSITYTVLASLILCLPLELLAMKAIFNLMFIKMDGYFEFYMQGYQYVEVVIIGMLTYFIINIFHMKKVKKIKLGDALKNRE